MKFGLKLWSINNNYVEPAVNLYSKGYFDYIELYTVPGSYSETIKIWKTLYIPFVIHAPHYFDGMCLGCKEYESENKRLSEEAFRFADDLNADIVIFHSGINGNIEETTRQILLLNDRRVTIENTPYYALNNLGVCTGALLEEIKFVMNKANSKFCLDIGHAICTANTLKTEPMAYLWKLNELNPVIYHFTDGDIHSVLDQHYHIGQGNYPLKKTFEIIRENTLVTIESNKDNDPRLNDFKLDIKELRKFNVKS